MFWKSTYNEFIKIAAKPRSYIGLAAITALVSVILFAMKVDGLTYISFITASFEQTLSFEGNVLNGNLMAFIILQTLIIQIPLLVALVTGDLVSGEADMGSLRMLATKPISRTQLLLSKFLAGNAYTLLILVWLGVMALGFGRLLFGDGDMMILKSDGLVILKSDDVMWRFLSGFAIAFLALVTIANLSVTLSCFTDNSIGPIVTTMAIIILFTIIGTLDVPVFDPVRPLLFTTHMAAWRSFFDDPVPIRDIVNSIVVLVVHNVILLSIALFKFNKKDILS
ncbi:MAG: ABC transporter permease subunit [Prolixibacteraceae bacterium]|nr:ABC transporter permease subunit [Prolixibacteraceae bacterium]